MSPADSLAVFQAATHAVAQKSAIGMGIVALFALAVGFVSGVESVKRVEKKT